MNTDVIVQFISIFLYYWFSYLDEDEGTLLAWMPIPNPPYKEKFICMEKQDNS